MRFGKGKRSSPTTERADKNAASHSQTSEIVGKARNDFWRLLEQRNETSLLKSRPSFDPQIRGLFHDFTKLVAVLTKHPTKRTEVEQLLIADEIANTSVCQDLGISPAHVVEVAKWATVVNYAEKSCVIREGQCADTFYLVLEGSLKQEKVIGFTEAEDNGAREILFANIVQAINIAGADVSGTSDPYVCVRVGTREERSRSLTGTLQPIWDEVLRVDVGADDETVLIALYDDDAWGDDDYLGSVEVPLEPLRQKKHFYHQYCMKLEADDRFVAAADEEGTNYSVCGTIIFHLKLTTQAALDKLAKIEECEPDLNTLNRFVSGQTFGHEMMQEDGTYPFTLNVEFECTLLRLTAQDYEQHVRPLQDTDTDRLIELFSEILPFHFWNLDRLQNLRKLVHVRRYKAGDVITSEGDTVSCPMFLLSGEVYAFKKLPLDPSFIKMKHILDREQSQRSLCDGYFQSSHFSELAQLLQPTPERDGSAFLTRLLRGDSMHFSEMLHGRRNAYTTVAATPVEIVASNRMKVAHSEKCLTVHRGEGLSFTREIIIDSATCETLCKREMFHDQESKAILKKCTHDQEWKEYKNHLISNIVFEHRLSTILRGPAHERLFAERKSPDRSGLSGSFQYDVVTDPKLPSLYENLYRGTPKADTKVSKSLSAELPHLNRPSPDSKRHGKASRTPEKLAPLDSLLKNDYEASRLGRS